MATHSSILAACPLPRWLRRQSVCLQCRRPRFDSWVRKIHWRRKWRCTPVLLPGKSHGWRSLIGYSPQCRKELDMTERLHFHFSQQYKGFPGGTSGKEPACQCRRCKRHRFDPWDRKIPWRRAWQPTLVFLSGGFQGQRNLAVYSPQRHKESDTNEATELAHFKHQIKEFGFQAQTIRSPNTEGKSGSVERSWTFCLRLLCLLHWQAGLYHQCHLCSESSTIHASNCLPTYI